jgi:uncharacterized membrane protein
MAPHRPIDGRRVLVRFAVSIVFGIVGGLVAGARLPLVPSFLVGWDLAGVVMVSLSWLIVNSANCEETRKRAGSEDPGRKLVYVVVLVTSCVSLLAATLLVRSARSLPADLQRCMPALCLFTVALAWTTTHTAFTFRYAHLFYREDAEGVGGVSMPGEELPTYFDFAYFAFTIGMCFQVSDVCVTSPQIRRLVLVHALVSFAYNSIVLAFILNLVFGSAG